MPNLTDSRQALELVHSLLSKSTDTLTLGAENTSRTEQTSVSVHTDAALTPTDTAPPASVSVSVPSVHTLTVTNAVQDEKNPSSVSVSVHFLGKEMSTRDPNPSGCPTPWHALYPLLPQLADRLEEIGHPLLTVALDGKAVARLVRPGRADLEAHACRPGMPTLTPEGWLLEALNNIRRYYPRPQREVVLYAGSRPVAVVRRKERGSHAA